MNKKVFVFVLATAILFVRPVSQHAAIGQSLAHWTFSCRARSCSAVAGTACGKS